jgi:hypothetical protein
MARIISIKGIFADSLWDFQKVRDYEKDFELIHINTEFVVGISVENCASYDLYGNNPIPRKATCISRAHGLKNLYTNQTIEQLIEIINNKE